ncbi:MAG: hypothetical protein II916_09410, partial [Oscillospiraceae bacterium]|nr:hypothetical protein [Oscillospiraceae bacterium]
SGATIFGQADMVFDPESGLGLVILINEYGGNWYIENVPALVFGHTTAEHYLTEPAQEIDTSGFFVMSRSVHHGMMKFMGALNGFDLKTMAGIDKAADIGQNVCAVYADNQTMLVGKNTYENGSWGLEQPSNELMHDSGYVFKLLLLTVYMLAAVTTIFLLRIRFRLHREKVDATLVGSRVLAIGQAARLISLALLLTSYVYYAQNMGGVPEGAAKCIGIGQMLCAAVCVVSAIAAAAELFRHKELWRRILNGLHILCSVCIVTAVLYFEMYQFWGC